MSATLFTPNLKLPYYNQTDFTDWDDYSDAMRLIDTAYGESKDSAGQVQTEVENLTNAVANVTTTQEKQTNDIASLKTANQNNSTSITQISQNLQTTNKNLDAAQNDIENLFALYDNVPENIGATLEEIEQKNKEQDTAIQTAQAEANAATEAAEAAQEAAQGANLTHFWARGSLASTNVSYYDGTWKPINYQDGPSKALIALQGLDKKTEQTLKSTAPVIGGTLSFNLYNQTAGTAVHPTGETLQVMIENIDGTAFKILADYVGMTGQMPATALYHDLNRPCLITRGSTGALMISIEQVTTLENDIVFISF